ncbi:MAG: endonuclease III [Candidatus Absconditabacterales bacterium]
MNKNFAIIFAYLKKLFPNPETELHYSTPFQLVVAVMLSAQATDVQVNKVTDKIFKKIKKPEDLLNMGVTIFENSISSINYYHTKAKHIFETAKILKQWKQIPSELEELMKLPGVGIKTAKVIAHVLYDKPFIAVDTHIHRVSNRLGLVKTTVPEKTSELLEKRIPDEYKDLAHHALVLFGRYYCTARNPKCENCKLKTICLYYKPNVIASKAKQSK